MGIIDVLERAMQKNLFASAAFALPRRQNDTPIDSIINLLYMSSTQIFLCVYVPTFGHQLRTKTKKVRKH